MNLDNIFREEQSPEPEEPASEYAVSWFSAYEKPYSKTYKIEHIKSSNLVSLTFENRGDAEGFLKWYKKRWPERHIEGQTLLHLIADFDKYKAETAEPQYVCPEGCEKEPCERYVDASTAKERYWECPSCGARSGNYLKGSQVHESWKRKQK